MRASLISAGSQTPSGKKTASAYLWALWEETESSDFFTSFGKNVFLSAETHLLLLLQIRI